MSNTGTAIPEWIKQEQTAVLIQETQRKEREQREATAAKTVREIGWEYWQELLEQLHLNLGHLSVLGLAGTASPAGFIQKQGTQICRVQVRKIGAFPSLTYVDLHYSFGGPVIRMLPEDESRDCHFSLCVMPDGSGIGAIHHAEQAIMSAKQLAALIVKEMADQVRR